MGSLLIPNGNIVASLSFLRTVPLESKGGDFIYSGRARKCSNVWGVAVRIIIVAGRTGLLSALYLQGNV